MKKILLVGILIVAILASVVTGTLAVYSVSLDELSGDAIAKEFAFSADGYSDWYRQELAIAPTESIYMPFSLSNKSGNIISEVDMSVDVTISISTKEGKNPIIPLIYEIYSVSDKKSEIDEKLIDFGTLSLSEGERETSTKLSTYFPVTASGTTAYFVIKITWVDSENDNDYQGAGFGNTISVNARATQGISKEAFTKVVEEKIDAVVGNLDNDPNLLRNFDASKWFVSNDNLRNYMLNSSDEGCFDGTWPTVCYDGKFIYLTPYFITNTLTSPYATNVEYVLLAQSQVAANWNTKLVYADGKWYERTKEVSINTSTANLSAFIQSLLAQGFVKQ